MGDPKKIRKKYSTPRHPWQKTRIEEEKVITYEFGLANKREIWMISSKLKNFKGQLKRLNALSGPQAEKEKEQLRNKLLSLGLIQQDSPLNTVLGLETKDLMARRLQSIVFKKNLARSIKQARQFITHRHILISGKKITAPSHLVNIAEEGQITFVQSSALADPNHPERYEQLPKDREVKKKEVKKAEEEIAAFDTVPKDEEAILKEGLKQKTEKETEEAKEVPTESKEPAKVKSTEEKKEVTETKSNQPKVEKISEEVKATEEVLDEAESKVEEVSDTPVEEKESKSNSEEKVEEKKDE